MRRGILYASGLRPLEPNRRDSLKRKIAFFLVVMLLAIAALVAIVIVPVGLSLVSARRALTSSPQDLSAGELKNARADLVSAGGNLDSPPARLLRMVPVVRQNLEALQATVDSLVPVLDASLELKRLSESILGEGIIQNGRVDLDTIERLEEPLAAQARALALLEQRLKQSRDGWLVPGLWSELDELLERTETLSDSAASAADIASIAGDLLGRKEPRTYLILMLNNTELRGAGGILSGVGTVSVDDGRLELGDFSHYADLSGTLPFEKVPAPKDYEEHFGSFKADTTRWVTTSSSPDVPDVAIVARNLYRVSANVDTDGALVMDPRGLASLLPPSTPVGAPSRGIRLQARAIPRFVYSDAYQELGGATDLRRDSLVDIGKAAFQNLLETGLKGRSVIDATAKSFGAEHLRFVSFRPREEKAMVAAGVAGDLGTPSSDGALVTVQNLGGNKLDLYARRSVEHRCNVGEGTTVCDTIAEIDNGTPLGLTPFQYQYEPYGLFKNFVEIYVPEAARLEDVTVDERSVRFSNLDEDGYRAVGAYLKIPRGETGVMRARYELPTSESGYSLSIHPQPLTRDARVSVSVIAPEDWTMRGPDGSVIGDGAVRFDGILRGSLEFEAFPDPRTGIAELWSGFTRFIHEPLF